MKRLIIVLSLFFGLAFINTPIAYSKTPIKSLGFASSNTIDNIMPKGSITYAQNEETTDETNIEDDETTIDDNTVNTDDIKGNIIDRRKDIRDKRRDIIKDRRDDKIKIKALNDLKEQRNEALKNGDEETARELQKKINRLKTNIRHDIKGNIIDRRKNIRDKRRDIIKDRRDDKIKIKALNDLKEQRNEALKNGDEETARELQKKINRLKTNIRHDIKGNIIDRRKNIRDKRKNIIKDKQRKNIRRFKRKNTFNERGMKHMRENRIRNRRR